MSSSQRTASRILGLSVAAKDDDQQYVRERGEHLADAHDHRIGPPAQVAGDQPESDAEHDAAGDHGHHGEDDGVLNAPEGSGEHIPSRPVRARPVVGVGSLEDDSVVLLVVPVRAYPLGEDAAGVDDHEYDDAGDGDLLAHEPPQGTRKVA